MLRLTYGLVEQLLEVKGVCCNMWWKLEVGLFIWIYLCGISDDIEKILGIKKDIKDWKRIMGRDYYK